MKKAIARVVFLACLLGIASTVIAHGPTVPPDPWEGVRLAHGAR